MYLREVQIYQFQANFAFLKQPNVQWSHGRLRTWYYLSICGAFRFSQLHNCTTHNCTSPFHLSTAHSIIVQNLNNHNTAHLEWRRVCNWKNIKMVVDLGVRPQLIPPQPPPSICNASKHTDTYRNTHTYTHAHKKTHTHTQKSQKKHTKNTHKQLSGSS